MSRPYSTVTPRPEHKGTPVNAADAPALAVPVIPPHPSTPQGGWLGAFPRRSFLELGAYRNAAGSARGHARCVLAEWGLGDYAEAVTLVISELVTNSVAATEKVAWEAGLPPVRLWLLGGPGASGRGEVLVAVWDAVDGQPARARQALRTCPGGGWGSWTGCPAASGTGTCPGCRTAGRSPGR